LLRERHHDHKCEPTSATRRWGVSLGLQSVRGGAVSTLARAVTAVVQVGSVLCLARLLTPEDYGLVAMVTTFTGFAPVFVDLGPRDAVVQRPRITESEVSALFWLTLAIGCACALAVGASCPLIAGSTVSRA
jgi:O-antigen/teichoic acid export membrane protein